MSNYPDIYSRGYQIESKLGHNRAGGRVTYKATNLKTKQTVVIKQFQFAQPGTSWMDYEAYTREIEVLISLVSPNIPRYLDSFETPTGFCLVQEYKRAYSLAQLRHFTPQEIKEIALAVLDVLVYLQSVSPPVIHRDLKPENILVDHSQPRNVYLVDFGFAHQGNQDVGVSSVVKGTLGFMPPEQLFNRQLSEASDLYSLGVTLICLLTKTKSSEVGNLIDEAYRFKFRSQLPEISGQFVRWLEKMVAPNPKKRYPNAVAAKAALKNIPVTDKGLQLQLGEKLVKQIKTMSVAIAKPATTLCWILTLSAIASFNTYRTHSPQQKFTSHSQIINPLSQLRDTGKCPGCYLPEANLEGANLQNADLEAAYLRRVNFEGAYLRGANFRDAFLKGANLEQTYLRAANLNNVKLEGANLQNANLGGVNMQFANLVKAYFKSANLEFANLKSANLKKANLEFANLKSADLTNAYLEDASLEGVQLENAHLIGAKLKNAQLHSADLANAELSGANLENANLEGADLAGADLAGANLKNANLWNANLVGAKLKGAILPDGTKHE
ncbi:serine/threonine-protein kinase [Oscillatoria salina]|uniref:serine/threonine-protein kinase n=1 Tax=Oscillatoria salina TaxID=331517 RepID=UPI001CCF1D11|nr:serine/threonine-protein kinase [Oscillatoria salina]MBZ8179040.1 protein kinase [Oscillatoria salina IIICB1]